MMFRQPKPLLLRSLLALSIIASSAIAHSSARAEDWQLAAKISQQGVWSSNPLMKTGDVSSLYGSTTSPELSLQNNYQDLKTNVTGKISQHLFNDSEFSTTDLHQTANIEKNAQRWTASIRESFDYDTTRTSETTNYGLSSRAIRHTGFALTPKATYQLSPIKELSVSGTARYSKYDATSLSDYKTYSATASYLQYVDPNNALFVNASAQRYKTTSNTPVKIDSMGPAIGWQTVISPQVTASLSVGAQTSKQHIYGIAVTEWEWDYTMAGKISYKGESNEASFDMTREQTPHSNGTEALQTSYSLSVKHNINANLAANVAATYKKASYPADTSGNLDNAASARVGSEYKLTDTLSLATSYTYRYETLVNRQKPALDHSVRISLSFSPNPWTLFQ